MDSSLTVKPGDNVRNNYSRSNTGRNDAKVAETADLVEPIPSALPLPLLHDSLNHDLVDPEGREVLYRERDEVRRRARRRAPDQVLMRQRAYHQMPPSSADDQSVDLADPHADIQV